MASIEKRSEKSYRLIVDDPAYSGANRKQIKKSVKITDEALLRNQRKLQQYLQKELAAFQLEVERGEYVKPQKKSFEEFVQNEWKKNFADFNLGEYTRRNTLGYIQSHLMPTFGKMELGQVKTIHIVNFLTSLKEPEARKDKRSGTLSTNTILNIFKALKSIFDMAYKWNFISRNPIDGVSRPQMNKAEKKVVKSKKKSYTAEEASAAITALYEEPEVWRLYFIGVLLGGFRRGEMLAVEWQSVDFDQGGIHIEKQITFDEEGNGVEGEVKTEESEAFVPMPRWYMDELARFRREWSKERLKWGTDWKGGDKQYVFHSGQGEAYYPNTPSMTWRRLLKRHNLPLIRLHDHRHSTAAILRDDGADVKAIQERLRHTKIGTTADIYLHGSQTISRETADRLEKLNPFFDPRSQSVPNR